MARGDIPIEDRLGDEEIYWGSMLALAELIRSGCTSFADMYFKFDADEMVPVFNGQNMTQYALTDFHCDTDEQALNVRFKCMGYDVRYRGSL